MSLPDRRRGYKQRGSLVCWGVIRGLIEHMGPLPDGIKRLLVMKCCGDRELKEEEDDRKYQLGGC